VPRCTPLPVTAPGCDDALEARFCRSIGPRRTGRSRSQTDFVRICGAARQFHCLASEGIQTSAALLDPFLPPDVPNSAGPQTDPAMPPRVGFKQRLRITLVIGAATTALALARAVTEPAWPTDFDQLWFGARALIQGVSPYQVIGPGRDFAWDWPLFYPLPAVLVALPLAPLPAPAARVVFATLSGAVLAFAATRDNLRRLPLFLSASFLIAVWRTQWSPLLTAGFFIPALGALFVTKPNIGLAVLGGSADRRSAMVAGVGMGLLLAVSLVVLPSWPQEWLLAVKNAPHVRAPLTRLGGPLLLLALLKWRRRDARVLLFLSALPHTPSLYDLLPLFVTARTRRQSAVLALLSHVLFFIVVARGPFVTFDLYADALGELAVFCVYLPALALVLRRRNVHGEDERDGESPDAQDGRSGALGRTDFALLVLLGLAATVLIWVTAVTRR
jgi:hypothetical protein